VALLICQRLSRVLLSLVGTVAQGPARLHAPTARETNRARRPTRPHLRDRHLSRSTGDRGRRPFAPSRNAVGSEEDDAKHSRLPPAHPVRRLRGGGEEAVAPERYREPHGGSLRRHPRVHRAEWVPWTAIPIHTPDRLGRANDYIW